MSMETLRLQIEKLLSEDEEEIYSTKVLTQEQIDHMLLRLEELQNNN